MELPPGAAGEVVERAIQPHRKRKAAIIEPRKTGALLRAIDHYHGNELTCLALKLAPLIFPRPINFRTMEWSQLQLSGPEPEWRIPWKRMKMRDPHIVPLSR